MKLILMLCIVTGFLQVTTSCSKPPQTLTVLQPIDTTTAPVVPPVIPPDTSIVIPPVISTDSGKAYLALGDSYTIGQSIAASGNYPNQTVSALNNSGIYFKAPDIIAVTGWTTANLLSAIANKSVPNPAYDVVTLLIGVNNQYQGRTQAEYKTEFIKLLQKSIAYAGNKASHVIVLSIPDYADSPYGQSTGNAPAISTQIDAFNSINKQISDSLQVHYINVTTPSRQALNDPSLFASDGLHYSAKEYAVWTNLLVPVIDNIIK